MPIDQLKGFRFICQQCTKIIEIAHTDLNTARGIAVKDYQWYSLFICSPKNENPFEVVFCCKRCLEIFVAEKL